MRTLTRATRLWNENAGELDDAEPFGGAEDIEGNIWSNT